MVNYLVILLWIKILRLQAFLHWLKVWTHSDINAANIKETRKSSCVTARGVPPTTLPVRRRYPLSCLGWGGIPLSWGTTSPLWLRAWTGGIPPPATSLTRGYSFPLGYRPDQGVVTPGKNQRPGGAKTKPRRTRILTRIVSHPIWLCYLICL